MEGGSLYPTDGTGTFQNIPARDARAVGTGEPAPLLPAPSPAADRGRASREARTAAGQIPARQRRGLGTSEELDPQPLPPSKRTTTSTSCIQVAERNWELLQEKRKKEGKKAGFQIRDHADHGQTQPHMQQSTGNTGSPATPPSMPGVGAKELLRAPCSPRGGQGPAPADGGASPLGCAAAGR